MNINIEKDLREAIRSFPKLSKTYDSKNGVWYLEGELDICDSVGNYWDTFEIRIVIPITYPHCVPEVYEISNLIPRLVNRHISNEGKCCLDMEHKLLKMASRGIHLRYFITNLVYPYFANQLYYNNNTEASYAKDEYKHHFLGVKQFYAEELNIEEDALAVTVIQTILANNLPGRNDKCICGGKEKFKKCHLSSVVFLKSLPPKRLQIDLAGFKNNNADE